MIMWRDPPVYFRITITYARGSCGEGTEYMTLSQSVGSLSNQEVSVVDYYSKLCNKENGWQKSQLSLQFRYQIP